MQGSTIITQGLYRDACGEEIIPSPDTLWAGRVIYSVPALFTAYVRDVVDSLKVSLSCRACATGGEEGGVVEVAMAVVVVEGAGEGVVLMTECKVSSWKSFV